MSEKGKEEKVWDAIQLLEQEIEDIKNGIRFSTQLTVALAGALGYTYKSKEEPTENGGKAITGWFEKIPPKNSGLILP